MTARSQIIAQYYAPISVKPEGGGGGTPGKKELSKLAEKNGFLLFLSLKLRDKMHNIRSKSPPWGYTPQSKSRGLPDPSPPPPRT